MKMNKKRKKIRYLKRLITIIVIILFIELIYSLYVFIYGGKTNIYFDGINSIVETDNYYICIHKIPKHASL